MILMTFITYSVLQVNEGTKTNGGNDKNEILWIFSHDGGYTLGPEKTTMKKV